MGDITWCKGREKMLKMASQKTWSIFCALVLLSTVLTLPMEPELPPEPESVEPELPFEPETPEMGLEIALPPINCQEERDAMLKLPGAKRMIVAPGTPVPECEADGSYKPVQCNPSTGFCWCVNKSNGKEHYGTRKAPGTGRPECNPETPEMGLEIALPPINCQEERDAMLKLPGAKRMIVAPGTPVP